MMITNSQLEPREPNADSFGVVIFTLLGIPIKFITFLPIDNPILQISLENISNVPNIAVRNNKIAGDSVSKPSPANIAFND